MQSSYEILKGFLQFGKAVTSSGKRIGFNEGYHLTGQAVDIVPEAKWINILIYYLFWPGGMGVDFSEGNFHIHIDEGPYRRWIE